MSTVSLRHASAGETERGGRSCARAAGILIGVLRFTSASNAVSAGGPVSGYTAALGCRGRLAIFGGLLALAIGIVAFLQGRKNTPAAPS